MRMSQTERAFVGALIESGKDDDSCRAIAALLQSREQDMETFTRWLKDNPEATTRQMLHEAILLLKE